MGCFCDSKETFKLPLFFLLLFCVNFYHSMRKSNTKQFLSPYHILGDYQHLVSSAETVGACVNTLYGWGD